MSFKPSTVVGLLACILAAVCVVPAQSNNTYRTVGEALQAKNLTVLLAAVQAAGIVVEPSNAFTILAPTNFAFAHRLNKTLNITPADLLKPESRETLQTVLGYHIIPSGAVKSSQLRDCLTVATALQDPNNTAANLTVHVRKGKVDFEGPTNDARVITADVSAGESVIHILDDVLLPPGVGAKAAAPSFPSLAAALQGANLTILAAAVQASGITLSPAANYTILAPSDYAFVTRLNASLGIAPMDLLQPKNAATLRAVLSYHVIPGAAVLSSQLTDGQKVPTALRGAEPLVVRLRCNKIDFEGATNDARVQRADISAGSNIVVHVVDDVLLPQL
ncbi:hypothetical protein OEZ85_012711 [Tetradesmus obliquus]|uniref:FAS1 domain-containing protein n=1 Tax=Tetradesmus obliquus TaxID=3088 RepID=A0ABY8U3Q0_TETOB|nr:hypothetical protein OEZ85_012711 [Tetradesmus obliquus]